MVGEGSTSKKSKARLPLWKLRNWEFRITSHFLWSPLYAHTTQGRSATKMNHHPTGILLTERSREKIQSFKMVFFHQKKNGIFLSSIFNILYILIRIQNDSLDSQNLEDT